MANVVNPNGFKWIQSLSGRNKPIIMKKTVTTGQTIAKGDALIIASGLLSIALSNSGTIYGVALEACTTAPAGTEILFIPAFPTEVFEAQCSGTYSVALDGTAVDIEGATGLMYVNENATTEQVFQIIGIQGDPSNAVGLNSRIKGIFVRSTFTGLEDAEA